MKANYHTHTYLCQHAYETPRDYIENAIRAGMETLGFSDHVPYRFLNGYVSKCRMPLSEIDSYLSMMLELREEYKGKIEILIGYEVEYYRDEFAGMLEEIRARHCDYIILGQHYLYNEYDEHGVHGGEERPENPADRFDVYADGILAGIETGLYSYVCHPDMRAFEVSDAHFDRRMTEILRAAKAHDMPIECNLHGFYMNRHYPSERLFRLVREVGNEVILGIDAHHAEEIGNEALERRGRDFLAGFGITPIEKLKLKPIL